MKSRYRIGVTQGDPKGIGPEIVAGAVRAFRGSETMELVVFGDPALTGPNRLLDEATAGRMSAGYVAQAVEAAVAGRIDAIVTAPIHKGRWHAAGIGCAGHTEFLPQCVNATHPPITRMLFWSPAVRIVCVTTHVPLRDVSTLITPERIRTTILLTQDFFRQFTHRAPRLACLGLNPHAGESGLLGREEIDTIIPTLNALRADGVTIDGPFPADSFFARHAPQHYDAVIAMYHDQGLIPIKTLDPHGAVNITMGLPFLRTSVGHGTADDIAGTGRGDPRNLCAAIETAQHLLAQRDTPRAAHHGA